MNWPTSTSFCNTASMPAASLALPAAFPAISVSATRAFSQFAMLWAACLPELSMLSSTEFVSTPRCKLSI